MNIPYSEQPIRIQHLPAGLYVIRNQDDELIGKFIKK